MKIVNTAILVLATTFAFGCDTSDGDADEPRAASWSIDGLEPLGGGYVYEGWLIIDGEPVSTGRFNVTAGETVTGSSDEIEGAGAATAFVLTVEPGEGDDPAPSASKLMAASLDGGEATLSIAHADALATDLTEALGQYIIETPTSMPADDYDLGIWFVDADNGTPTLDLPELPEGWQYEGWLVTEDGPLSTGRFDGGSGADSDGAGPDAGPLGFPPFPGQDFIEPPMSVVGTSVVVSVEPEPDDSDAPFVLKPLVAASVEDVPEHGLQSMENNATATNPTGTVRLE